MAVATGLTSCHASEGDIHIHGGDEPAGREAGSVNNAIYHPHSQPRALRHTTVLSNIMSL